MVKDKTIQNRALWNGSSGFASRDLLSEINMYIGASKCSWNSLLQFKGIANVGGKCTLTFFAALGMP
jgi:hypothetical protein